MIRRSVILLLVLAICALLFGGVCIPELYPLRGPVPSEADRFGVLMQAGCVNVWYATAETAATTPPLFKWRFAGFAVARYRVWFMDYSILMISVPYWFLLDALALYPAIEFVRGPVRRWRRRRSGSCPTCGYNLTANESGRCPECGMGYETQTPETL